ncbi:hypothetical protein [Pengzhenrongella sicca]|uniref:Uncharacterized protein n=1 Tax=Pengzhenrongella sicca TaxID=2819238 RepID=A0A8A4ZHY0_9MICO|nr:hypothetical protein [Pengzhenrongella sicca]QTE31672.1 hypothetical protein J4E96_19230 [Pengzhenrongella sicca]
MARRAVDIATLAAPEDETARLDLVDVLRAEGHTTVARSTLRATAAERLNAALRRRRPNAGELPLPESTGRRTDRAEDVPDPRATSDLREAR